MCSSDLRAHDGARRFALVRAGAQKGGQGDHAPPHASPCGLSKAVIAPLPRQRANPPPWPRFPDSGTGAVGRCSLRVRFSALILLLSPLAACAPPPNETGAAFTETGQIIAMGGGEGGSANACFSCHGLEGEGDGVSVPRLAGLDAGYLQKQMED